MTVQSKAAIAANFLTMCATGRVAEAYELYVAENFQHHNAFFPSDRKSLLQAMQQSAQTEPNKSFTVKQTIASSDRIAVLSHLVRSKDEQQYAVVHILRFEDDKIAEMWDLGQAIPKDSPNQLGMF